MARRPPPPDTELWPIPSITAPNDHDMIQSTQDFPAISCSQGQPMPSFPENHFTFYQPYNFDNLPSIESLRAIPSQTTIPLLGDATDLDHWTNSGPIEHSNPNMFGAATQVPDTVLSGNDSMYTRSQGVSNHHSLIFDYSTLAEFHQPTDFYLSNQELRDDLGYDTTSYLSNQYSYQSSFAEHGYNSADQRGQVIQPLNNYSMQSIAEAPTMSYIGLQDTANPNLATEPMYPLGFDVDTILSNIMQQGPSSSAPSSLTESPNEQHGNSYKKTPYVRDVCHMGNGLFATRDIRLGHSILSERPFMIIHGSPEDVTLCQIQALYRNLSDDERECFLNLYRGPKTSSVWKQHRTPWGTRSKEITDGHYNHYNQRAVYFNAFHRNGRSFVYPEASLLNHQCTPNALFTIDEKSGVIYVHAKIDILEGDQIFINYKPEWAEMTGPERFEDQELRYGFKCYCPLCKTLW